jgi:hypothetical protein
MSITKGPSGDDIAPGDRREPATWDTLDEMTGVPAAMSAQSDQPNPYISTLKAHDALPTVLDNLAPALVSPTAKGDFDLWTS